MAFAAEPSVESWRAVEASARPEAYRARFRTALRQVRWIGLAAPALFDCVAHAAEPIDLVDLVGTAGVKTKAIVDHAASLGDGGAPWLALAALAAASHGHRARAVELLRKALRKAEDPTLLNDLVREVRAAADPELEGRLDDARIPNP